MSDEQPTDEMTELDRSFLEEFRPGDGSAFGMPGFLAVISWIDDQGNLKFKVYNQLDMPLSSTLGLLDLAKLDMVMRCNPNLFMPRQPDDDD